MNRSERIRNTALAPPNPPASLKLSALRVNPKVRLSDKKL